MADDRPRPTETDQDADDETPREPEPNSEVRPTADAVSEGDEGNDVVSEGEESADTTSESEEENETATGTETSEPPESDESTETPEVTVPEDVRKYERFKKMDGAQYDRVNEFLRERTYITAREWAIARLCADFRTETGVEMTKIGENLPELVPFMTDTYTPQAVNQARSSFENKVRQAGATFLYGAMSGFFTAEELDDMMYEVTEVAKFLLEVEGVDLSVEEELAAEDRISGVMRDVRSASEELRHDELECPNCGHEMEAAEADAAEADSADD